MQWCVAQRLLGMDPRDPEWILRQEWNGMNGTHKNRMKNACHLQRFEPNEIPHTWHVGGGGRIKHRVDSSPLSWFGNILGKFGWVYAAYFMCKKSHAEPLSLTTTMQRGKGCFYVLCNRLFHFRKIVNVVPCFGMPKEKV